MATKKAKKGTARGRHISDVQLFLQAGARMKSCEGCVVPEEGLPVNVAWINQESTLQQGGICTLFFIKCAADAFDETDQAEWQAAINAGDVIVIRDCSLEVDLATEPTTVTRGCAAEERVTSRTMTLNISDVVDNTSWSHASFWQYTQKYPKAFRVAFATYDGTLYPSNQVTINVGLTIDNTLDGFKNQTGSLQWKKLTNDIPLTLAGGWSPDDLIIPNCTVNINFLSLVGGDLELQAVPMLSQGAVSATYAWTVNGSPSLTTTPIITVAAVAPGDDIEVTVTDNLGCVSSSIYTYT